jgi:arylsulfatase A-like enzyme
MRCSGAGAYTRRYSCGAKLADERPHHLLFMKHSRDLSIFQNVIAACLLVLLIACSKQTNPKAQEYSHSVVHLESLLHQRETRFRGGVQINSGNFDEFEGNGWQITGNLISAKNKRAILILPHLPVKEGKGTLKFRARAPQNSVQQRMVIDGPNLQLASVDLKKDWQDYRIDLPLQEWRKIRFIFDGKKMDDSSFAEFTNFELQFFGQARLKIQNEFRPSILVPLTTSFLVDVMVPLGKPRLSLGAGLEGDAQEALLTVDIHESAKSKTLLNFSASSTEWRDQEIDLSPFAGKKVTLEFKSSARSAAPTAILAWSNLEIYDLNAKRSGPNVILFSVDALRWDHLSYYGYPIKTSPNLDDLARKSTVFKQAYCTAPSTLPSHTSLMTGLYVGHHHVGRKTKAVDRLQKIPDNLVTLAELASERDYRTAAITDGGYVSSFYGFGQGFQQYRENDDVGKNEVVQTIDDAVDWLKKNSTRPFFLFLHSYEVHEPFTPPRSAFQHLFPDMRNSKDPEIYNEWLRDVMISKITPTAAEKDLVRKAFDAEVYFFDQQFGKILKELQNSGLGKNTVIVVISDHGQQFFERGNSFGHASSLFTEEIQVPLILYIPGKPHQERKEVVSLVDLYPTLAHLMGHAILPKVDGLDLVRTPAKQFENRAIYYEINFGNEALWGMQNRQYKMIVGSDQQKYFFDLQKDPSERKDLSGSPPRAAAVMKDLLSSYIEQSTTESKYRAEVSEQEENDELSEKLCALGYVN